VGITALVLNVLRDEEDAANAVVAVRRTEQIAHGSC
jgi:hypothetical protein